AVDAERRQKEGAAGARHRQIEFGEARRRKKMTGAAEAAAGRKAEGKRREEARNGALEEARRKAEGAAEDRRTEQGPNAALHDARRNEEKSMQDERFRLAATPTDEERAAFVKRVQEVLKRNQCYAGKINGRPDEAQQGVDSFVENAGKKGNAKPPGIKLAK